MSTSTKFLICVVGPTAIGKTALGIQLAKYFNTEIVSADSRQFFKEMEIGTAVPNNDELNAAKHHCIQHISIADNYSVGDFEKEALGIIETIHQNNNIAILVGGSGLYVDAVTKGLDNFPDVDASVRAALNEKTTEELQQLLHTHDIEYYNKVDLNNRHRLIRALEVCIGTNKPYTYYLNKPKPKRPFETLYIGITAERQQVYDRINLRVDLMIQAGLLAEAKKLFQYKHLNALQTVGYRELFDYFEDKITLEKAIEEIKKNTRRFAKRQFTWFKKNEAIVWFDKDEPFENIIASIEKKL